MAVQIKKFSYDEEGKKKIAANIYGKDWPVVYLLNSDKRIYVGETSSAAVRTGQHLQNEDKKKQNFYSIRLICDDTFNKSAVLDIEQLLIKMYAIDGKFDLVNQNGGQSAKHNYYQREKYQNMLEDIWKKLKKEGMTRKSYHEIINSDLYKYSPYTTLTNEQRSTMISLINDIVDCLENKKNRTSILNGSAGTGKTILIISLIYILMNNKNIDISNDVDEFDDYQIAVHKLIKYIKLNGGLKIGFVLPMQSIRQTLKKVFKNTKNGLDASTIIGPSDVKNEFYDVLFVDEAHRLCKRKNITNVKGFDDVCKKLNMDPNNSNQLDWIIKKSKYRVLVYDENQTIKGSDVSNEEFKHSIKDTDVQMYQLVTQMRCKGGNSYVKYINDIFECNRIGKEEIVDYDFKIFDDVDVMVNKIKSLDKSIGLCRNVAGYSWKWKSKGYEKLSNSELIKKGLHDIEIDGHKYIWNRKNIEYIISDDSVNQIGCVHTTQGYDLNYVGIIYGEEIDYLDGKIMIDLNKFYDVNVKRACSPEEVKQYIINAYKVLMTRGIKGCYVYACNKRMRDYLSQFIDKYKED